MAVKIVFSPARPVVASTSRTRGITAMFNNMNHSRPLNLKSLMRSVMYADPFLSLPLDHLSDADRVLSEVMRNMHTPNLPRLATDVYEDDKAFYLKADLPGMSKENVKVALSGSTLQIIAERSTERSNSGLKAPDAEVQPGAETVPGSESALAADAKPTSTASPAAESGPGIEAAPSAGAEPRLEAEATGTAEAAPLTASQPAPDTAADASQPTAPARQAPRVVQRSYGCAVRSFTLPKTANGDAIKASVADGVLTVTIPKLEEAKPVAKLIPIEA